MQLFLCKAINLLHGRHVARLERGKTFDEKIKTSLEPFGELNLKLKYNII
jgi:hypothetical protein